MKCVKKKIVLGGYKKFSLYQQIRQPKSLKESRELQLYPYQITHHTNQLNTEKITGENERPDYTIMANIFFLRANSIRENDGVQQPISYIFIELSHVRKGETKQS